MKQTEYSNELWISRLEKAVKYTGIVEIREGLTKHGSLILKKKVTVGSIAVACISRGRRLNWLKVITVPHKK